MGNAVRNVRVTRKPAKQDYTIIIPAAGQGTRMKSYGVKSLIKIDDEAIIDRQLRQISQVFKNSEIIVVTGFESNRLTKRLPKHIKTVENKFFSQTNVVYSIGLGLTVAEGSNIIIIYGDLVFSTATLIAPYQQESILTIDSYGLMKSDEVGCVLEKNMVCNMMYGLSNKWGQIAFITGNELEIFKKELVTHNCARFLGFEMLNRIISKGGKFKAAQPKNMMITDIDTSKDIPTGKLICQSE
jgi:choline kinase